MMLIGVITLAITINAATKHHKRGKKFDKKIIKFDILKRTPSSHSDFKRFSFLNNFPTLEPKELLEKLQVYGSIFDQA